METGSFPQSVAIGDLDGDGDLDLAVANGVDDGVSVLLNNRSGVFGEAVGYQTGDSPMSVAIGDFDSDGSMDLAVANSGLFETQGNVAILLNIGNGGFGEPVAYETEMAPTSVAVGDFDGDDKLDLAVANLYGMGISILVNRSDGTFADQEAYPVEGLAPRSVASGDLDRDGDLDLAVVTDGRMQVEGNVSILLNAGDGTFTAGETYVNVGGSPMVVAVGNLDGDDAPDLAIVGAFANRVFVLLNNGDGTFNEPTGYTVALFSPVDVAIADLNDDGHNDVITANAFDGEVSVMYSQGDGTFGAHSAFDAGADPRFVAVGDLNGDQDVDLVVTNQDESTLSILLSQ